MTNISDISDRKFTNANIKIFAFVALAFHVVAFSGLINNIYLKCLLGIIGSSSLTLFAFLIAEGVKYSANLTKYMLRSLLIAVLSALPYRWVYATVETSWNTDTLFSAALTSFYCIGSIALYKKMKTSNQRLFCIVFVCVMSFIISLDLAPYAVIISFIAYMYSEKKKFIEFAYYITSFSAVISIVSLVMLFTTDANKDELYFNICLIGNVLALPIIKQYNGERGPKLRFMSYSLYIVILLIIIGIKYILSS